jgi:hypothetical protein
VMPSSIRGVEGIWVFILKFEGNVRLLENGNWEIDGDG